MLVRFLLIISLNLFVHLLHAQTSSFEWAASFGGIGGTNQDYGVAICSDSLGNSYSVGDFTDNADFDPGAGTFNLSSAGGQDVFIYKLDPSGGLVWAVNVGGAANDRAAAISLDNTGNLYIAGHFSGTVDFDPGAGTFNLISNGQEDAFLLKLDTSGVFQWASQIGGAGWDEATDVTTDLLGNVILSGVFSGNVDLDPTAGTSNATSNGSFDAFLIKLDANGAFQWANSHGNANLDNISGVVTDSAGNIYSTGYFMGTVDLDPGASTFNLTSVLLWNTDGFDVYVQKLDPNGNLVWVLPINGGMDDRSYDIELTDESTLAVVGEFQDTLRMGALNSIQTSVNMMDAFIFTLSTDGTFKWSHSWGGLDVDVSRHVSSSANGLITVIGDFEQTVDFDPTYLTQNVTANGGSDVFIQMFDPSGYHLGAVTLGGSGWDLGSGCSVMPDGSIYSIGTYMNVMDLNPFGGTQNATATGGQDWFILKLNRSYISGYLFNDLNQNCVQDAGEPGLDQWLVEIQPGNIYATTHDGYWVVDTLSAGTYTLQADTSGGWTGACGTSQQFTVASTSSPTVVSALGIHSSNTCISPEVSIHAPFLRPGFSNKIYVQVCNGSAASSSIDTGYVDVELDGLLMPTGASVAYSNVGGNVYRFEIDTLAPGECMLFWVDCDLDLSAQLGQTLCMEANLITGDSCFLDTTANPYLDSTVSPCTLPWDNSSLNVEGYCINDSIVFVITNTGDPVAGDMDCWAPVRIYIDGQLVIVDSVMIAGGDSVVYSFEGTGETWQLQADQHPLHPGNSHPNAYVELCGSSTSNWTPNLVNTLPLDDADPITDIYCGIVTGSYDPNDKTGYPLGVGNNNAILPNQNIEYLIRFQNTGNDTAFTVVIRDTLSEDLDINSVVSGVSSHSYDFEIYGNRILEWTFSDIMLPDSTTNEPGSHGFVKFNVSQVPNLPLGTVIENEAGIYFDFNAPIITNTYLHTIDDFFIQIISSVDENHRDGLEAVVAPNPFSNTANIYLRGITDYKDVRLSIYDMTGKELNMGANRTGNGFEITRGNLPTGIYLFRFTKKGQLIATGKMIVQ